MRNFHHTSRRNFITAATAGLIGSAFALPEPKTRVRSVIHLFMDGGMSHLDTFDPKPGTGAAPAISTNVPGISISANLPRLAGHMDKITLVRSMSHTARNHQSAKSLTTDFYGEWTMADGITSALLLAKNGVPNIRVELEGWDTHTQSSLKNAMQCQLLDDSLSQMLENLSNSGMLDQTLVILTTEFGRSAKLNSYGGRNHHPQAYTCLFAGGGTHGGRVIGATSPDGMEVCGSPTHPQDFGALLGGGHYS
ncbi:MAG: DUF1501 domain-containing protein [Akkermansiaceae bacterium]|nr:DUF1501 domain-containing protein [Akkermansiaceae bacterium]MDP4847344.1 DUF1501 domain-containing protein [Akkermansiaceae bacterium]MDP4898921.1 DUF1501 domain-containing protein [Akkermansiaceae bacterium]MDP4997135.1 DUF1501 domain-containing protein [Akkermansiaceae bacterium]